MRVVLITMTNRPLGLGTALAVHKSGQDLIQIIAQKRFAGRGYKFAFLLKSIKRHGFRFVFSRIKESLALHLGQIQECDAPCKGIRSLAEFAKRTGVEYALVEDANSPIIVERIAQRRPDVIILANAPIIRKPLIDTASRCAINLHRSLLPKYAGLDAIFWALYHGEIEIGATVHVVSERIDDGAIVLQEKRAVSKADDLESLTNWYYITGPRMIVKALDLIENDAFVPTCQDMSQRSYYSWPTRRQRTELRRKLARR